MFTSGERKICSTVKNYPNIMNMVVAEVKLVITDKSSFSYFLNIAFPVKSKFY